ncbi:hypothetical protein ACFPRL_34310 [Pseudoclavibacter helvolus]
MRVGLRIGVPVPSDEHRCEAESEVRPEVRLGGACARDVCGGSLSGCRRGGTGCHLGHRRSLWSLARRLPIARPRGLSSG